MSTKIAIHVSYAGVFGDVVRISGMAEKMAITRMDEFNSTLNDLVAGKQISIQDGYAALPYLASKIKAKANEQRKAELLIKSKLRFLRMLGRLPIIKFIGISGSLAAGNPVLDADNKIDIDVFVITRNQCMWFFFIPLVFIRRLTGSKVGQGLCFNMIMDESDLRIYNRNFYTANEMRNLIPVSGFITYNKFMHFNNWINIFFPGFTNDEKVPPFHNSANILNKILFLVYNLIRCVKNISIKPIKGISFKHNPFNEMNVNRIGQFYGGYHAMVLRRFIKITNKWFPGEINDEIIQFLFPDNLSKLLIQEGYNIEDICWQAGRKPLNLDKYEEQ
jgi:hypothetical protein